MELREHAIAEPELTGERRTAREFLGGNRPRDLSRGSHRLEHEQQCVAERCESFERGAVGPREDTLDQDQLHVERRPPVARDQFHAGAVCGAVLAALEGLRELPVGADVAEHRQTFRERDGIVGRGLEVDESARVVATAQIAGQLAKTLYARPTVLRAASAFLAAHWGPERVQSGDPIAIAAFAQWYANTDDELSDAALQWCGRELERGFRTGAIDALATARVFALCDAQALPGAQLGADEVVLSLAAAQAADGGFGPPAAPVAVRVAATLDALAALARLTPRAFRAA